LVGGGVGIWGLPLGQAQARASDVVSLETDVAMGSLALPEEAADQEEKVGSVELSPQSGTCLWQDGCPAGH